MMLGIVVPFAVDLSAMAEGAVVVRGRFDGGNVVVTGFCPCSAVNGFKGGLGAPFDARGDDATGPDAGA